MAPTIPVSIEVSPEAASRIRTLNLEPEFEQMLVHAREAIPGLRDISVDLQHLPEEDDEPRIVIEARVDGTAVDSEVSAEWNWAAWITRTFPPQVFQHFVMLTAPEENDVGRSSMWPAPIQLRGGCRLEANRNGLGLSGPASKPRRLRNENRVVLCF